MSEEKKNPEEKKNNPEEKYQSLKEKLDQSHRWPSRYMFKFICPNEEKTIEKVKEKFDSEKFEFRSKPSKTGKFISLTFVGEMKDSDEVIEKYKSLENIEGLIAL